MSTSFQASGIYPFNSHIIPESKLAPSHPYSSRQSPPQDILTSEANWKLYDLEEMMKPSSAALFNTRYEEHYDDDNDIWSKLITLSISTVTVIMGGRTSPLPVQSCYQYLLFLLRKHQKCLQYWMKFNVPWSHTQKENINTLTCQSIWVVIDTLQAPTG